MTTDTTIKCTCPVIVQVVRMLEYTNPLDRDESLFKGLTFKGLTRSHPPKGGGCRFSRIDLSTLLCNGMALIKDMHRIGIQLC